MPLFLQERQLLVEVDDGTHLAPLSQGVKGQAAGISRFWGLMYGTQALEPSPAWSWKATALMAMLERKIMDGGDLAGVLQQHLTAAKTGESSLGPRL